MPQVSRIHGTFNVIHVHISKPLVCVRIQRTAIHKTNCLKHTFHKKTRNCLFFRFLSMQNGRMYFLVNLHLRVT